MTEQEKLEVVQGEEVESTVVEVVLLPGVLVDTRKEGLRLKGVTIPFVGETPTGGESTKFLPRSSRDFFKQFLKTQNFTIRQLSVDHLPVNLYSDGSFSPSHLYSVPQPWSGTRSTYSYGSRPRKIYCRRSHKARTRVEPNHTRLHFSPSHQRSLTSTDRQAANKTSLPEGAGREESGPGDRRCHKGSSLLRFSAYFTILSHIGVVAPKRGPRDPQGRRGISQSDLYRPKDGTRERVRQKIHTQSQSK